jgi:hypothetical protein
VRTLAIALEDGFVDDRVVVTVDGKVVLDEEHVRTRTQTGLARLVKAPAAAAGDSRIEVTLPARRLHATVRTSAGRAPNVRVSVRGDRVVAEASAAPLFYA